MTTKEAIEELKAKVNLAKELEDEEVNFISIEALDLAIKALEARPQGKWVEENSETGALGIKYTWFKCNQCNWSNSLVIPRNFCPNCGADMRGKA